MLVIPQRPPEPEDEPQSGLSSGRGYDREGGDAQGRPARSQGESRAEMSCFTHGCVYGG